MHQYLNKYKCLHGNVSLLDRYKKTQVFLYLSNEYLPSKKYKMIGACRSPIMLIVGDQIMHSIVYSPLNPLYHRSQKHDQSPYSTLISPRHNKDSFQNGFLWWWVCVYLCEDIAWSSLFIHFWAKLILLPELLIWIWRELMRVVVDSSIL